MCFPAWTEVDLLSPPHVPRGFLGAEARPGPGAGALTPPLEPLPRLERQRGSRHRNWSRHGSGPSRRQGRRRSQHRGKPVPPPLPPGAHAVAFRAQEPWQPMPPQECGVPWGQGVQPPPPQSTGPLEPTPRPPRSRCCRSAGVKAPVVAASGAQELSEPTLRQEHGGHLCCCSSRPFPATGATAAAIHRTQEPQPLSPLSELRSRHRPLRRQEQEHRNP
ncbi:uncharacterized protein ACOB7L_002266 [Callospermophilus lateralis]|uniref:uncharacterized protein LOC143383263 n=1 Tax=Callospermophilus lateralis TaxID=76772 RepID=UPI004038AFB1